MEIVLVPDLEICFHPNMAMLSIQRAGQPAASPEDACRIRLWMGSEMPVARVARGKVAGPSRRHWPWLEDAVETDPDDPAASRVRQTAPGSAFPLLTFCPCAWRCWS